MPNEYARAVHELVQAKIEQRAPEVEIETTKGESPKVINIMDALKKSMQAKGQTKVGEAVRKKMGKAAPKRPTAPTFAARDKTVVTPHCALAFTGADKFPTHFDAQAKRILLIVRFNHNSCRAVENMKAHELGFCSLPVDRERH